MAHSFGSVVQATVLFFLTVVILCSCYRMRTSRGGGETSSNTVRKFSPNDVLLTPGYEIKLMASGLTFPSSAAVDKDGALYVVEAGYSYGEVWVEPKLLRINADGSKDVVAKGGKNGPWNGVAFHDDNLYISEGGALEGGKILRVSPDGKVTTLAEGLPSMGDHHTNALVIKDGYVYFGQGSATNSGIVGPDNADFGWLSRQKNFHDIPCGDLVLNGVNYESPNVLTDDPLDKVSTGAFSAFGSETTSGQVIKGAVPCTGAILRVPIVGGQVEMVAWGLRNPYGLAIANDGRIFTTENAFDERGSRPVWGAGDVMWEVQNGSWYGWPDFSEGKPINFDEEFKAPSEQEVKPLLKTYPNKPPKPAAILGVHSSSNGFDFSKSDRFGFVGEAFVAQFGDMAPDVGKVLDPVGFKIVRVNVGTGVIRDFATNKGKRNGPASWLKTGGFERPISVTFDNTGENLYVIDFGILTMKETGPEPLQATGCVWKISKTR
jgi:glucose/arabinose dehydrogenase